MNAAAMFEQNTTPKLIEEIDRYLAAIDLFRAEDCEPAWQPELEHRTPSASSTPAPDRLPSDIRLH